MFAVFGSVRYILYVHAGSEQVFLSIVGLDFVCVLVLTHSFMTVVNLIVLRYSQSITNLFRRNPDEDRPPHPVANATLGTPSRRSLAMDSSGVPLTRSPFHRALPEVLQHCHYYPVTYPFLLILCLV